MKNASDDIQMLRGGKQYFRHWDVYLQRYSVLQDVESNMKMLRMYLLEFRMSRNVTEEYEVLPEIITSCFHKFHDNILALKTILPRELTPGFAAKAKWVFDKWKVKEISMRLNDRKSNLSMALAITGQ